MASVGAVLAALHDQLIARGGLEGVNVFRFGAKPEDLGYAYIVLCTSLRSITDYPTTNTRNRLITTTIQGVVSVRSPGDSTDGDEETQAAMDRAEEVYGELQEQIAGDNQVNGTATSLLLASDEHVYGTDGTSRFYQVQFALELQTQLN